MALPRLQEGPLLIFEKEIESEEYSSMPSSATFTSEFLYPFPFHVRVTDFVTELSGEETFKLWNKQMTDLLEDHGVFGFVSGEYVNPSHWEFVPKAEDMASWIQSDTLVKGWILASLTEELGSSFATRIQGSFYSKDLWDEIQSIYGPTLSSESEVVPTPRYNRLILLDDFLSVVYADAISGKSAYYILRHIRLGNFKAVDKIGDNGDTVLHALLVGSSTTNTQLFEKVLATVPQENRLSRVKNLHGSTLLHVAAVIGNLKVVDILIKKDPFLLKSKDIEGKTALALSILNSHSKLSHRLLWHIKDKCLTSVILHGKTSIELMVLAISSKDFSLAREIEDAHHPSSPPNDDVLMALAQNFPRDPYLWGNSLDGFGQAYKQRLELFELNNEENLDSFKGLLGTRVTNVLKHMVVSCCCLPSLGKYLMYMIVRIPVWLHLAKDPCEKFSQAMYLLDKECLAVFSRVGPKMHSHFYTRPLSEATTLDSCRVVASIIKMFPDGIWMLDQKGHNLIQQSIINRSENVYNLLYGITLCYNTHRSQSDIDGNNLLHLAATLSPSTKFNRIRGALLQFQYDLKWYNEVAEFIPPSICSVENFKGETPQTIFTREHKELMKAAEEWLKVSANSYIIVAGLVVTASFAGAITVPGGTSEKGHANHEKHGLFHVFIACIALSFGFGFTSLLYFLSILNARFGEQDFVCKLPTKFITGLSTLFVSLTAMIIAFLVSLLLLFGSKVTLFLYPIGGTMFLALATFVMLQFALIKDLIISTYGSSIFVGRKQRSHFFYLRRCSCTR